MSRADETTQVDYSLLDDRALGDAVAEKVLGWEPFMRHPVTLFDHGGGKYGGRDFVSWWGAGLVIDLLAAEGWGYEIEAVERTGVHAAFGRADDYREGIAWSEVPVRAILIAALRAREAETQGGGGIGWP